MPASIRLATPDDAAAILAIYAPNVRDSAISFELEPPTIAEMRRRVETVLERNPWLVMERAGQVAGYAYATTFRARAAYRWTVETSVYVHSDHRRAGVARALMQALLATLELQGYHRAVAGATLPNDGSARLHEALGFRPVGTFAAVGLKFGTWHDVGFWELALARLGAAPPEPLRIAEVAGEPSWRAALERAAAGVR